MTTEDYAQGYKEGYDAAYNAAYRLLPVLCKQLQEHIARVPKLHTGYSVYDGGYEDGVQQALKLIDKFFNTPVSQ